MRPKGNWDLDFELFPCGNDEVVFPPPSDRLQLKLISHAKPPSKSARTATHTRMPQMWESSGEDFKTSRLEILPQVTKKHPGHRLYAASRKTDSTATGTLSSVKGNNYKRENKPKYKGRDTEPLRPAGSSESP